MDRFDEKTVLVLPNGKGYSFQAKGFTEVNGGETMTLAYQVPGGGNSILEVSFLDVAIAASETYTTEIGNSSDSVPPLVLPDGTTLAPDTIEVVEVKVDGDASQIYLPLTVTAAAAPADDPWPSAYYADFSADLGDWKVRRSSIQRINCSTSARQIPAAAGS